MKAIAIGGPANMQYLEGEGDHLTLWVVQSLWKNNPRQIPHEYRLKLYSEGHFWVYSRTSDQDALKTVEELHQKVS